jgi:hypothetical protein
MMLDEFIVVSIYNTSRGHGCGFLTADYLPIAALLK